MPRRRKDPRPPRSTYYPSQQQAPRSTFGDDRPRFDLPR
jgi:hypothetical protein